MPKKALALKNFADDVWCEISAFLSAYDLCRLVFCGDKALHSRLYRAITTINMEYTSYVRVSWPRFVSPFSKLKHLSVDIGPSHFAFTNISLRNVSYSSLPRSLESLKLRFFNAGPFLLDFMKSEPLPSPSSSSTPSKSPSESSLTPPTPSLDALANAFPNLQLLACPTTGVTFGYNVGSAPQCFSYPGALTSLSLPPAFPFCAKNLSALPRTLLTLDVCLDSKESAKGATFPPILTDLTIRGGTASHAHFSFLPRTLTTLRHLDTPIVSARDPLYAHLPRALTALTANVVDLTPKEAAKLPPALTHLSLVSCNTDPTIFGYTVDFDEYLKNHFEFGTYTEQKEATENLDALARASLDSQLAEKLKTDVNSNGRCAILQKLKSYSDSRVMGSHTKSPEFASLLPRSLTSLHTHWTNNVPADRWHELPTGLQQLEVRGYRFENHKLSSRLPIGMTCLTIYLPTRSLLKNLSTIHLTTLVLGDGRDLVLKPSWLNTLQCLSFLELGSGIAIKYADFANFTPKLETLHMFWGGQLDSIDWTAPWTSRLKSLRFKMLAPPRSSEETTWESQESIAIRPRICLPPSLVKLDLLDASHYYIYGSNLLELPPHLEDLSLGSVGVDGPILNCFTNLPKPLQALRIFSFVLKHENLNLELPLDFALKLPPNMLLLSLPRIIASEKQQFPATFRSESLAKLRPYLKMSSNSS